MKRILTVLLLAATLICGGLSADAQKKKSSAKKATSSATMKMNEDGYPNIVGHTYRYSEAGAKVVFKFNANDVTITLSERGQSATEKVPYTYKNGTVGVYDPGVPNTPMFEGELSEDGKSIFLNSGYVMKLVK